MPSRIDAAIDPSVVHALSLTYSHSPRNLIHTEKMAEKIRRIYLNILLSLSLSLLSLFPPRTLASPTPKPWPLQFHSILFINSSSGLQVTDLWYDWPNGRNFNIIQHQLAKKVYDLEWNNGTSFYYTLDANKECRTVNFPVGILRPNFLDGANYIGQEQIDGFLCNVWEKVDFIRYYEDVASKTPVSWTFISSGMRAHVMTFEVGKVLDDPNWQAPVYCFGKAKKHEPDYGTPLFLESTVGLNLMREIPSIPMRSN